MIARALGSFSSRCRTVNMASVLWSTRFLVSSFNILVMLGVWIAHYFVLCFFFDWRTSTFTAASRNLTSGRIMWSFSTSRSSISNRFSSFTSILDLENSCSISVCFRIHHISLRGLYHSEASTLAPCGVTSLTVPFCLSNLLLTWSYLPWFSLQIFLSSSHTSRLDWQCLS